MMPSNHLVLPLPSFPPAFSFPTIRGFSSEFDFHIIWPKYWSFSISPSNEYSGLISFRMNWLDLLAVQGTLKSLSSTTVWKHHFFGAQPSLWSNFHIIHDFRSDCGDHNKLWKILKEMGIPDHLTCLLRNLYAGQEATDWTWNNRLVPNRKRSTSRLYIVTLLI